MMEFPFEAVYINSLYFYTAFGKKQELFPMTLLGCGSIDSA